MCALGIRMGPAGYLVLFAWVFAEQIGLPVPATPALLAAGALAATGGLNVTLIMLVALAASLLGDSLWFRAGILGNERIDRFLGRHPKSRMLQSAKSLLRRYGGSSLVLAKFVPGLSLAMPPLSGLYGMKAMQFLVYDSIGAFVWAGSFVGIGYFSANSIYNAFPHISSRLFVRLLTGFGIGLLAIALGRCLRSRNRTKFATAPSREMEYVGIRRPAPLEVVVCATGAGGPLWRIRATTSDPSGNGVTYGKLLLPNLVLQHSVRGGKRC